MNDFGYSRSTVHDVAQCAGVSVGTVSRVLNGYANITPENHTRVTQAISRLGYRKSTAGISSSRRRPARMRTGNIGLILTGMGGEWANHPLIANYVFGVEEACRELGFHALSELWCEGQPLPQCLREEKIDGLLIKASRRLPSFISAIRDRLPFVTLGLADPAAELPRIASDNPGGGWIVADYLWRCGHRRIAFLCPDPAHPIFLARRQGYEAFLMDNEAYDPGLVVLGSFLPGTYGPEAEPPQMDALLARLLEGAGRDATAIVVGNDWVACGLYKALARRGLRVPEDISVVGFDNDLSICVAMTPPLTSCDMRISDVARAACLDVIERIGESACHEPSGTSRLMPGRLVERASVRMISAE